MHANIPTSKADREQLILSHLPQVELLARRLNRRCPRVELEDLIGVGTLGLIQAIDRFDPSRNLKINTLAEYRINGAMLDYLRQIDPLPRAARRFQKQRDEVLSEYAATDETPSVGELAQKLGISVKKYTRLSLMVNASQTVSLSDLPHAA